MMPRHLRFVTSAWILGLLVTPLFGGGCTKGDGGGGASSADALSSDLTIVLSSQKPVAGEEINLVVKARTGTIKHASWAFYRKEDDALSLSSINPCIGGTNGPEVKCSFGEVATIVAEVQVEMFGGQQKMMRKEFQIIDMDGIRNQSPIVVLQLGLGTNVKATMATFAEEERGEAVFPAGSQVNFDFRRTRDDENSPDELSYRMKIGENGEFKPIDVVSAVPFPEVGYYPITIQAVDAQGNVTEKRFTVFITCDPNTVPQLQVNGDAIDLVNKPDQGYNMFGFFDRGVRTAGGMGPYKYMWDFNGDGTWDTQWLSSANFDFADPMSVYVNHMHERDVRLKIWDTKCQYVQVASKRVDLAVNFADGVKGTRQGPQIPNYYFIQGKVRSKNNSASKSTNVDHFSGDPNTAPYMPRRVLCSYQRIKEGSRENEKLLPKAQFKIKGLEQFQQEKLGVNPAYKVDGAFHGIELTVNDVFDDTFSEGGPQSIPAEGRHIAAATFGKHMVNFYTDRDSDGIMERKYVNKTECDIGVMLDIFGPGVPCAREDEKGMKYTVQVDGTFSCPDMRDAEDDQIAIEQGAFFCEINQVDACHGGCCCCCCSCEAPTPQ